MKKLTFRILAILTIVLTGLINNSCTHKEFNELPVPSVCPSDTFQVLTPFNASNTSPDFAVGDTVWFSADFNESIKWKLTITGTSSGAKKTYEGESASVNKLWIGRADRGSEFFKDENVIVTFESQCQPEVKINMSIIANDWQGNGFQLYADFDLVTPAVFAYPPPGSPIEIVGTAGPTTSVVDPSPQGGNYYHIRHLAPTDVWFLGGFGGSITMNVGTNDPSEIYANFFLNGNGITNTDVQFTLQESGVNKTYRKTADFLGWKMFSFKLSDYGVTDPSNITLIDFGAGSAPLQGKVSEMNIDFVLFTKGEPFYTDPVSVDGGPFLGE